MTRCLAILLSLYLLSGCAGVLSAAKSLTGSGTDVLAIGQAGKQNSQTIGASQTSDQKIRDVSAQTIKQSTGDATVEAAEVQTVIVHQYPAWLIIAFAAALFLDSPLRWPGQIYTGIRKSRSSKTQSEIN